MPGINGMEFWTEAKKTFPDVPIIVITGHMEQCTTDEALSLGSLSPISPSHELRNSSTRSNVRFKTPP